MARRFEIRVGEDVAGAELLDDAAPEICKAFYDALPVQGFCVHAKFAGEELILMLPFYTGAENEILDVAPGDIGYYPGRQTACMFYGATEPFGHVSVFARVTENLDAFRRWGSAALADGSVDMRLVAS